MLQVTAVSEAVPAPQDFQSRVARVLRACCASAASCYILLHLSAYEADGLARAVAAGLRISRRTCWSTNSRSAR
jgi:hypothetical protein